MSFPHLGGVLKLVFTSSFVPISSRAADLAADVLSPVSFSPLHLWLSNPDPTIRFKT
jgi:hypothetical protein